ncbi:hypothetical protein JXO52_12060 [bacterium]|nr:hypothetical protein [bacterium]
MIRHPDLHKWELRLKGLLDSLDDELEHRYGDELPLHPSRKARGNTANKAHDGLFDITANFSLGIGSKTGRSYVIDIHLATLEKVPADLQEKINDTAVATLKKKLPEFFPGAALDISRDQGTIRLHGDLSFTGSAGS